MSPRSKREYTEAVFLRYRNASRKEKTSFLDEFCATPGGFFTMRRFFFLPLGRYFLLLYPAPSEAWFDETHVAVAKAAMYAKWFNACGPYMIRVKMGNPEGHNHFVNNPQGIVGAPDMVMA
jgi:hypothetical protein